MASKQSASQKAAEARQAAAALRAKQRAAARRNTILASFGALILVVVFALLMIFIVKSGKESGPYTVYTSGEMKVPSVVDETDAILVGPGGIAGGTAPADAIRVDLLEDPICPWCTYFVQNVSGEIGTLVDQGEIAFYYHPVSILDIQSVGTHYSTRMASAWVTVAEYEPETFWAFVEASFVDPPEEGSKGLTNEEIADLALSAGVSKETVDRFADGEFTQWLAAATDRATSNPDYLDIDGRFGTPGLLIEGVRFGYWTTPGNITAGVAYVREFGAEAFAEYLATPQELEPSPSPSA
ncbi:MAG: thioredoxin domain-containing protein [Demequinaceae bacterium]|nr:thioredoxin domain-containing protein [Demequinaceae bacterium]